MPVVSLVAALLAWATGCAAQQTEPRPTPTLLIPEASGTTSGQPPRPSGERPPQRPPRWSPNSPGNGQGPEQAEQLFIAARRALNEGRYEEACPLFEQSMDAQPALGTLFNLAACEERTGRADVACGLYRDALAWAHQTSQVERERLASDRLARIGC